MSRRVSFSFLSKGVEMRLYELLAGKYELLAGKYVSVCKACGNLGGSGGMFPREILILDLLLDVIWWNLGLFLHKHKLPFNVSLKLLQRLELIYM